MNNFEFKKWMSFLLLGVALIFSYKAIMEFKGIGLWFNAFFNVLSPFFAGFVIAYLLNIPCSKIGAVLEKRKNRFIREHARAFSVLLTYLFFIVLIYLLLSFVVPSVYSSGANLISNMPFYIQNVSAWLEDFNRTGAYPILDEMENFMEGLSISSVLQAVGVENIKASFKAVLSIFPLYLRRRWRLYHQFIFCLKRKSSVCLCTDCYMYLFPSNPLTFS